MYDLMNAPPPAPQAHTKEIAIKAAKDYRVQGILTRLQRHCYFAPLNEESQRSLEQFWQELTTEEGQPIGPRDLPVKVHRWIKKRLMRET